MVFSAKKRGKLERAAARKYGGKVQWAGKPQEKRQGGSQKGVSYQGTNE